MAADYVSENVLFGVRESEKAMEVNGAMKCI